MWRAASLVLFKFIYFWSAIVQIMIELLISNVNLIFLRQHILNGDTNQLIRLKRMPPAIHITIVRIFIRYGTAVASADMERATNDQLCWKQQPVRVFFFFYLSCQNNGIPVDKRTRHIVSKMI